MRARQNAIVPPERHSTSSDAVLCSVQGLASLGVRSDGELWQSLFLTRSKQHSTMVGRIAFRLLRRSHGIWTPASMAPGYQVIASRLTQAATPEYCTRCCCYSESHGCNQSFS